MEQITAYRTKDGRIFNDKASAEKYEKEYAQEKHYEVTTTITLNITDIITSKTNNLNSAVDEYQTDLYRQLMSLLCDEDFYDFSLSIDGSTTEIY